MFKKKKKKEYNTNTNKVININHLIWVTTIERSFPADETL